MKLGVGAFALLLAPAIAHAQEPQTQPAQPPAGYVAPIYQQTQPSYVPQSVAMSGPPIIQNWSEDRPVPPGYHAEDRTRKGLVVGGAVTFGSLYLISVLIAAAGSDASKISGGSNPVAALYIPAIGPFIQMGNTSTSMGNVANAIDGIGQCAGLAMFIYGIASPKTVLVRNDLGKVQLTPVPMVGKNGSGIGLLGTF